MDEASGLKQGEVDFDMHKNQSRNSFALIFFVEKRNFSTRLYIKQIKGSSRKKKKTLLKNSLNFKINWSIIESCICDLQYRG